MRRLFQRGPDPAGRIAFNMRAVSEPWGGGNWWLTQMVGDLRDHRYEVRFDLRREPDCVVVVDPRVGGNVVFGRDEIAEHRRRHPETRVLHRINECDLRKGTNEIDALLASANEVADSTVFLSDWLRDYHAERWFDLSRPHAVVHNGADFAIFHPGEPRADGGALRLATHHWSANPLKGFDVYREVDRLIADGSLPDTELWVIGRWPDDCDWQAAHTFPPTGGTELADLLRSCDAYITASRFEPGGMHYVEGAQCGLPVLYHEDGGGIVEVARRFGIGFRDDVASAIEELRGRLPELQKLVRERTPSGEAMCAGYRDLIAGLIE